MASQAYTEEICFPGFSHFRRGGGSKPPPYEILYRFFCALMFRAHVIRESISILFASRGRGEELPSCGARGRRAPVVPLAGGSGVKTSEVPPLCET